MQVSVTIITKNEAAQLRPTLQSVRWASEIVVVDSGSTDATCDIAREFTPRVVHRDFTDFSSQKNFAQSQATHDWILNLDADEICTEELAREIQQLPEAGGNGYSIRRKNFFQGRWIKHCGWDPDYKLRLYRRSAGAWKGRVHESVLLDPHSDSPRLSGALIHNTYKTMDRYLASVLQYSKLAALEMNEEGKSAGIMDLVFRPPVAFLKKYCLQLGFLDGAPGFVISALTAYGIFCRYGQLAEISRHGASPEGVGTRDENHSY